MKISKGFSVLKCLLPAIFYELFLLNLSLSVTRTNTHILSLSHTQTHVHCLSRLQTHSFFRSSSKSLEYSLWIHDFVSHILIPFLSLVLFSFLYLSHYLSFSFLFYLSITLTRLALSLSLSLSLFPRLQGWIATQW